MMTEYFLPIAIIAFLILLNGLFVAAEFAIIATPYTRITRLAKGGSQLAKKILPWLKDPAERNRYIATAQVGITIASLGLGMYGEHTIAKWLLGPLESLGRLSEATVHLIALILAVGILTYLHVVVGEMVPKSIAIQYPERSIMRLANSMAFMEKLFSPLVRFLNAVGDGITALMGVPPADAHDRLHSPEELEYIVEESASGGMLDDSEKLYLENIFDLGERTVVQVMTPRNRIHGFAITDAIEDVLDSVCQSKFSRYPIYDDRMDQIVGVLHVKTLARHVAQDDELPDLAGLLQPALFAPETLPLSDMLRQFRKEQASLALIVDEYGGTAGLITIEDIIEEVVGEILDEYDQEMPPMIEIEPGVIRARGDLLLDELDQHYDLDLGREEVDTVGGLVMGELGRVPAEGEDLLVNGVRIKVEKMDGVALQSVLIYLSGKTREQTP